MTVRILRSIEHFAAIAALSALTACSSDLAGSNTHAVQFSFTTHVAATPTSNLLASDQAVDPAGNLVLNNVQIVLGKLELDRTGSADCVGEIEDSGDDHGRIGEECEDVSRDPVLVDIPVDGTLHPIMNIPLAAGSFSQLEAKIEPAKDRNTEFNAANPKLVRNSVRVRGTIKRNGVPTAFDFTAPVRAKLEMEFDPPLVIDATTRNATVSLDVSRWFLDSSGNVIDPATATAGSTNLRQIESNIRRSFHAFEDDHERGEDHHEGHNGNDDGGSH
jgi:hypothetical protein